MIPVQAITSPRLFVLLTFDGPTFAVITVPAGKN